MSTVLICREALEDSILGNLALVRSVAREQNIRQIALLPCSLWTEEMIARRNR